MSKQQQGLDELLTLRSKLDGLIEAFSASNSPLRTLDDLTPPDDNPPDGLLMMMAATLSQMQALVDPTYVLSNALRFHVSSCMRVAVETHVEEQLREADKPLSAVVLAKPTGVDPDKLARCLRLLAAHHMFREVEHNVFARNRHSVTFDKHTSIAEILRDPFEQFSSGGAAAFIAHVTEEGLKSAAYTSDTLLDPKSAASYDPQLAPFARAYGGLDPWAYFSKAGNDHYLRRFASAMRTVGSGFPGNEEGFPWKDLPSEATVVDVGGGTGHLSLAIGSLNPHLKFIVQDRAEVIENEAPPVWKANATPEQRAKTQLMAHDFFTPNPVKNAEVYLLRAIIHDWPDSESIKILSHLADAAGPSSRLVIIESTFDDLTNNYPPVTTFPYLLDLQMLCALNAQERSESQYSKVAKSAGWKFVKTWKTGPRGTESAWRHYEFTLDR